MIVAFKMYYNNRFKMKIALYIFISISSNNLTIYTSKQNILKCYFRI